MLVMLGVPSHHVGKLAHAGQLDRCHRARSQRHLRGRDRAALVLRQGQALVVGVGEYTFGVVQGVRRRRCAQRERKADDRDREQARNRGGPA